MPFLKLTRDLSCCFSDYDEVVKNCILGFGICEKLIIAIPFTVTNCAFLLYGKRNL